MRLNAIQRQLERIYEIRVPHDVDDFLITDPTLARILEENDGARTAREKLLVREDAGCLDISLYVDAEIVDRLGEDNPIDRLHRGNLEDFCVALEGVSHFLYLVWNALHERGVSLLEMEMQAEVDKFVSTAVLFGHQGDGRVPPELFRWLFTDAGFDGELSAEELERYRNASFYAGRYCARLESDYLRNRTRAGLVNDLRRFYRLTQRKKIEHATAGAG